MDKKKPEFNYYYIIVFIIGIIFLLSGIGKTLNTFDFGLLLQGYGNKYFYFLSPLISIFEIYLGLNLIFRKKIKFHLIVSISLLIIFSIIFGIGYLVFHIRDCGCYGTTIELSPTSTFIRNFLMLGACFFLLFIKIEDPEKHYKKDNTIIVLIVLLFTFVAGSTYNIKHISYFLLHKEKSEVNKPFEKSTVKYLVEKNIKSNSLIFIFSENCYHCLNSLENVKKYYSLGYVDEVVGISYSNKENMGEDFRQKYDFPFEILLVSRERILELTKTYPTSYIVLSDTIKHKFVGVVPSPFTLSNN